MKGFTQLKFTMAILAALLMLVFSVSAQQSDRAKSETSTPTNVQRGGQGKSNSKKQGKTQVHFVAPVAANNAIQIAQQPSSHQIQGKSIIVSQDDKGRTDPLAPYLSQPQQKVIATFTAKKPLSASDLPLIPAIGNLKDVWVAPTVNGHTRAATRVPANGESMQAVLEAYASAADAMAPILEQTKPDPTIVVAVGHDYGITGFSVEATAYEVSVIRESVAGFSLQAVRSVDASDVEQSNGNGSKEDSVKSTAASNIATEAATAIRHFVPNRGTVTTGTTQIDNHEYYYISEWVYWDNAQSIADFSDGEAYEHQLVLERVDKKLYFGGVKAGRSVWSADWDSAYLDTQALNSLVAGSASEVDYTIGCFHPRQALQAGKWYQLWMVVEKGKATVSPAKITGQAIGRSCDIGPWCVFGDQVTQWMVNAWDFTVPTQNFSWLRPQITRGSVSSTPVAGQQFYASLEGGGFNPSSVRVIAVGPGCETYGSCQVSNTVLRSSGSVTSTAIQRIPLTLGGGTYKLTLENGSSGKLFKNQLDEAFVLTTAIPIATGPLANFTMSAQGKTANDGGALNLSVPVNGNITVNFVSTSKQGSAPITSYIWKSNGAQICGNSSTCSYNFGTASNKITLTVTDSNGLLSTATGQVNLTFTTSGPTAHFTMSAQGKSATDGQTLNLSVPVNGNVTVAFNSTSSPGSTAITGYVWRSNGTQICGNSSTCSYNFGTASNQITLTVTDSNGKTSVATGQLNLTFTSTGPTTHFTMSAQGKTATDGQTLNLSVPVNGNVTVAFNNTSSPGSAAITNYVWRSNGTQICGNSATCSYNFGTPSNQITLDVTDSNGKSSTATGQLNLTFTSTGPTGHFMMSAQGKTATDGQTLNLSVPVNGNVTVAFSSTSVQGSAAITSYVWRSNGTQICGNSSTCSYNFGTASNQITLTVTDSNGLSSTATGQLNLTFTSTGPTAHFTMSAQGKTATDGQTLNLSVPVNGNVTVAFNSSSVQGSAGITSYVWRSNGTQICGNSSTCSYNFGTAGSTITLMVTDSNGLSSTATGQLNLTFTSTGPTSHFTMSAQGKTASDGQTLNLSVPVNGNVTVNFASTSVPGSAAITNYVWRSNGTQICGNSSTCSYNFGTAGNTIALTVTDSNGLSSTATGQLNLSFYSALAASCSISPNPITLGTGGTAYAQALGGISPYSYIINGFNMGSVSSQAVMPTSLGTFTVPVTIFDSQNQQASNSCSAQVVSGTPYLTGFNYSPNPAKATQVVSLNIYGGNFVSSSTQVWFVGPGCSAPGCQTNAVNVVSAAYISAQAVLNITGTYTVNIRNGSGPWVQAGTVTVVQ